MWSSSGSPRGGPCRFVSGLFEEDGGGAGGEVVPAVSPQHGAVHLDVELPKALDVGRAPALVVEAVVGLRHSFVAGDHQGGAVVVIGLARRFEDGVRLEIRREGEGLEAVVLHIRESILKAGTYETPQTS